MLLTAIEHVGEAAKEAGIPLRQSYVRVAKLAAIRCGRYLHAKQMKRAKREQKFMRVRLKRLIRDVRRKSDPSAGLPDGALAMLLGSTEASMLALIKLDAALRKASHIANQKRGDKDYLYSWHAPEVECISKGKARAPYEFGCKVSIATNLKPAKAGHFILHARALHGNPYDGHTLTGALEDIKEVVGRMPLRVAVDKGYKGHGLNHHPETEVYITGQKRGVTDKIKRWLKRRAVVEPVIGHGKNDGLLGTNWLAGRHGDRINATLAAAGFNLRQLLRFLRLFWLYFLRRLLALLSPFPAPRACQDA